ncbi:MAG TPA: cytochrome c [Thermomicrobiales bacterium]|nr:cytochrome c [Thermomicrobiales bacterium]
MKRANIITRIAVLAGAALLLVFAALPLLGNAQNATPAVSEQQLIKDGETTYNNVCIACHQPDGNGIQGIYLPLNNNPLLTGDDPTYFISTVLTGRGGMPTFAGLMSDEQIAGVVSYVRQVWDNSAAPVSPEQVAAVRAQVEGTPEASPTPFGQRPEGNDTNMPSSATSTPVATP